MPVPAAAHGIRLFVEGQHATEDDVKEGTHTLYIADRPDHELHAFKSESAMLDWANNRQDWTRVGHLVGMTQLARHAAKTDLERPRTMHSARYKRFLEDLDQVRKETGLDGTELYRRATLEAPILEGPISHSAFLHEHSNGTGNVAWMPGGIPVPDFRLYGMNDLGSSLTFWSLLGGVIFEHVGFQGRAFGFWGIGFIDLTFSGFDNIASSGWAS